MARQEHHDKDWRYVLSAGRTGTVFLETLIGKTVPGVTAIHEPSETRLQMMLANLRNDLSLQLPLFSRFFLRSRLQRAHRSGGTYVEINPFLCAMTDLLPDPQRKLRVVHMVREPGSWAQSITAFKASTRFRAVIDHVPFATPYPSPRPEGWRSLTRFEKALWRWHWCNSRILAIRDRCDSYALVRYEDVFSEDIAIQRKAVSKVFEGLGIPEPAMIDHRLMGERLNPAPPKSETIDRAAVSRICGALAKELGYAD